MIPWKTIDAAAVPGSGESLQLRQRGDEFSIRGNRYELMNSRMHGSEEALATLACQAIAGRPQPRILIGGLGMGYTLAAALAQLSNDSRVTVAELVPAVVQWNRGPLAHLAGHPLKDARVRVVDIDVAVCLRTDDAAYDAVILDIDNGPDGLTRRENDWIYGHHGVSAIHAALRPHGVLAVWSAAPDTTYTERLYRAGFQVQTLSVPARSRCRGTRHTIWLAARHAKSRLQRNIAEPE